jgi:cell division protein ZapA
MENTRVVKVEVHGLEYPIRSGLDPAYVAELASYVDAKMRVASRETVTGDTLKIAVLAALNIADECFRLQAADRERRDSLTTRAEELERMLDLALGLAPAGEEGLPIRDGQLSPAAGSLLR